MRRYSTSEARRQLADVLDRAEHGELVVIERKGVRFRVTIDRAVAAARKPVLEIRDPAVERGEWTWRPASDGRGLAFSAAHGSRALRL